MFQLVGLRLAIGIVRGGFRASLWIIGTLWLGLTAIVRLVIHLREHVELGARHSGSESGEL